MQVYKFGGASIKDADSIINMGSIVKACGEKLLIVASAMGKTTNALEEVVHAYHNGNNDLAEKLELVKSFHVNIIETLRNKIEENNKKDILQNLSSDVAKIFEYLNRLTQAAPQDNYDLSYDQIVPIGELLSTKIISSYLSLIGVNNEWVDARKLVLTDSNFRNASVDWPLTTMAINQLEFEHSVIVTQGFIGGTKGNFMTTLGREGSDYSGAIFANVLNAESITIWKDVDGVLNADPKYFNNTTKLDNISYKEAIELAYFGASVIHPKTIKPLQNKSIPLMVKSFKKPSASGTLINENEDLDGAVASYIFKQDQVLISFSPKDFSFIEEQNISEIFDHLSLLKLTANTMQNSAINFSVSVDFEQKKVQALIDALESTYNIKYNKGLELLTIRHPDEETKNQLIQGRKVLLEQRTRNTIRVLLY